MRVAIYARKSTDDNDKNPDHKSVTRQVEHAKAFAEARGWTVNDDRIFMDDGISGAEYQNRPGFTRLLTCLKDVDVLVMSEPSRLGRDMLRNAFYLGEIIEAGTRIFYYLTQEEEKLDTPEQKIMATLKSYASEVERQKASQRARDALERKALRGQVAGGRVYGLRNVWVSHDAQRITATPGEQAPVGRTHTEHKIDPAEAQTLRSIFRAFADGHGCKSIAKALNGDPSYRALTQHYFSDPIPPPPSRGSGSWAPSSIYAMLRNERYLGFSPYGEYRKVYRGGTKKRERQPEYHRVPMPQLRIIDDTLWNAVQARMRHRRNEYLSATGGALHGRPVRASRYLFSGLARCECCGGSMVVISSTCGSAGQRRRRGLYVCSYHHHRGSTVCQNDHREWIDRMDEPILSAIEGRVLSREAVHYVVDRAAELVLAARRNAPDRVGQIDAELRRLHRELDHLVSAIATGGAPERLVQEIARREARIKELGDEHQALTQARPVPFDVARIRHLALERAGDLRAALGTDVPAARKALQQLLVGPVQFIPMVRDGRKTYSFRAELTVGPLLDARFTSVASPTGFEPVLRP